MTTKTEMENQRQRIMEEGRKAQVLLRDGSEFLTFVGQLQEHYREAIFATDPKNTEEREDIYRRMRVLDELISVIAIAKSNYEYALQQLQEDEALED